MAEDEGKPSRMTEQAITVEIIDENNNELNEISIDDKVRRYRSLYRNQSIDIFRLQYQKMLLVVLSWEEEKSLMNTG